jgi:hypothetical protein
MSTGSTNIAWPHLSDEDDPGPPPRFLREGGSRCETSEVADTPSPFPKILAILSGLRGRFTSWRLMLTGTGKTALRRGQKA